MELQSAPSPTTTTSTPSVAGPTQMLTFFVRDQEFGIEILRVRELQSWTAPMPVPQSPAWLKGVIYSNEYLFLYQEHGCACAQTVREETLGGVPVVRERFVFAEDGFQAEAASFYGEFLQWAKNQQITTMIVEEMTDVPHDLIKERLGRLFERKQIFARI